MDEALKSEIRILEFQHKMVFSKRTLFSKYSITRLRTRRERDNDKDEDVLSFYAGLRTRDFESSVGPTL